MAKVNTQFIGCFLPGLATQILLFNGMKIKLATTPEEQRRWMEQWRQAAVALEEMRRFELANLTEKEARRNSEAVLSMGKPWRRPHRVCGLVEQQALFKRLPKG